MSFFSRFLIPGMRGVLLPDNKKSSTSGDHHTSFFISPSSRDYDTLGVGAMDYVTAERLVGDVEGLLELELADKNITALTKSWRKK